MKLNDAIKEIIKKCNKSQIGVYGKLGIKSGAWANMMKRNNVQVKTLLSIADELGYELVLRPKDGIGIKERSVVIDMAGEE